MRIDRLILSNDNVDSIRDRDQYVKSESKIVVGSSGNIASQGFAYGVTGGGSLGFDYERERERDQKSDFKLMSPSSITPTTMSTTGTTPSSLIIPATSYTPTPTTPTTATTTTPTTTTITISRTSSPSCTSTTTTELQQQQQQSQSSQSSTITTYRSVFHDFQQQPIPTPPIPIILSKQQQQNLPSSGVIVPSSSYPGPLHHHQQQQQQQYHQNYIQGQQQQQYESTISSTSSSSSSRSSSTTSSNTTSRNVRYEPYTTATTTTATTTTTTGRHGLNRGNLRGSSNEVNNLIQGTVGSSGDNLYNMNVNANVGQQQHGLNMQTRGGQYHFGGRDTIGNIQDTTAGHGLGGGITDVAVAAEESTGGSVHGYPYR
ncbi:hypothetical protein HDU76_011749 [Blyttiomyces sp. JEL0837]|nr:hypothetical protein HDU76_011749 [Blyttiomyces sp. JEL0837]